MDHAQIGRVSGWLLTIPVLLATTGSASANYYELLRRVPDSANTIILVDVERMLMSPIAMREKWRDKANASRGAPIHFPINAERYLLASKLNFVSNLENLWDAGMIETISEVSLPYLSRMEGGYLDTVDGQQVVYSPRNAFFVSFKPTIVGMYFPANRQDLGRWLRSIRRLDEPQVSAYLRDAVARAHGQDHIVVAFDLADLFSGPQVREFLHQAESLAGKDVDLDAITKVLASVRGVTLTVRATDRLDGAVQVDFGESPSPLRGVAKALMFEVLEKHGMMLQEMKDWAILVEAKAVTLRGRMGTKGLRTLTELIPIPAETVDLKKTDPKAGVATAGSTRSSSTGDSKVATSRKYYQHIIQLLDQLQADLKTPGLKPKVARRMLDKAALEIDHLPVLNVDEELLAYGTGVSETLRNMRNLSENASLDASYRQAAIEGNSGYGGYGYGGFYGGSSSQMNTNVMRRQETAVLKSNQLAVFTMLQQKTAEIRKKMTLKYQVEF